MSRQEFDFALIFVNSTYLTTSRIQYNILPFNWFLKNYFKTEKITNIRKFV